MYLTGCFCWDCNCLSKSEAKIQVNRVRPKWVKWEREYEDDEVTYLCSDQHLSFL